MREATKEHLCPSAPAADGAFLLGVVGPTGQVAYVQPLVQVDAEFVERAAAQGPPEARFRFSGPCVEARCGYWTGSACGVIEQVLDARARGSIPEVDALPHCMIRPSCRWYAEAGSEACMVCPFVITKTSPSGDVTRVASVPSRAMTAGRMGREP